MSCRVSTYTENHSKGSDTQVQNECPDMTSGVLVHCEIMEAYPAAVTSSSVISYCPHNVTVPALKYINKFYRNSILFIYF